MKRSSLLILLLFLALAASFLYVRQRRAPSPGGNPEIGAGSHSQEKSPSKSSTSPAEDALEKAPEATQAAPLPDQEEKVAGEKKGRGQEENTGPRTGFGNVQPVSGKGSPQAASVLEALKSGRNPERLSVLHPPKEAFDRAAFEKDPEKYLNIVEPGRVFQTCQPSKDIPALSVQGSAYLQLRPGQEVKLSVKGAPGAPVTFTALDLGTFKETNLNSATVKADQNGLGSVTFVATQGAMLDVNILAGSPLASGQARFKVDIEAR